ncbi:YrhK family protein [Actinomycetospora straminea]|uniref:YrhK domain-containing protein n=1 Tax=Actinomycetospora straminea TaxID=663607 RepID=A0ABP9EFS5_9PSEU|nr:YrhK family protein [Actinomycetospora straminea]MDD7933353.1 YrhK family protein [Actinomycetospora straminea]
MSQDTSDQDTQQQDQQDPDAGHEGESITISLGNQEIVLRQRYELLSIINDIGIFLFFTVGSVAFYWHELFNVGVTLFVIGSVQLGFRPLIRLFRRIQLRSLTKGMPHEVARDF